MGILRVYEFAIDRNASEQRQLDGQNNTYQSSVNRWFCVETDSEFVSQVEVRDAVDPTDPSDPNKRIPASGDPHPDNSFLFALGFEISLIGSTTTFWKVEVIYESIVLGSADPLQEPPEEEWDTDEEEVEIDTDEDDEPIVNTAGEYFDPPIKTVIPDLVLTRTWNVASINWGTLYPYIGALNNVGFLGFLQYTAKCRRIRAQLRIRGALSYYRMTVVFGFRTRIRKGAGNPGSIGEQGWKRLIWNNGYRLRASAGSSQTKQLSNELDGTSLRTPAFLNADGTAKVDAANAIILEPGIEKYADLNQLLAYTG